MPTHCFDIGPLQLRVDDPRGAWGSTLPPNFRPFAVGNPCRDDAPVAVISDARPWDIPSEEPLSEAFNDLGVTHLYRHSSGGWLVSIAPRLGDEPRLILIDPSFRSAEMRIAPGDPAATFIIDSMLRIFFSQYAATRSSLLIHASTVELDGHAYVFMGRSGTGKSTHSRLWLSTFHGAALINDDVPLITLLPDGTPTVCGTPWSGKGCIWRRVSVPLRGIVRLVQAPADSFTAASGIDAFIAILPGLSVMTADPALYSAACTTAIAILDNPATRTGILRCTPRPSAARLSLASLTV